MKRLIIGLAVCVAVLMTVVAASGFGYLRIFNQNQSDAGAGLVWQLVPTSGK